MAQRQAPAVDEWKTLETDEWKNVSTPASGQNVYKDASGKLVDRRATSQATTVAKQAAKYPTREKFGVESGENMTVMEAVADLAKANAVGALQLPASIFHGAVGLGKGMYGAIGNPEKQAELLGGIVKSTAAPFVTMGRNVLALDEAAGTNMLGTQRAVAQMAGMPTAAPTPEENRSAAEFSGANAAAMLAEPAMAIVGKARTAVNRAITGTETMQNASRRVTQSWLKPNKNSMDFGRDPVHEVAQLPKAYTIKQAETNIQNALADRESSLMEAIQRRQDVATAEGLENGIDIAPMLKESVAPVIKRALMDERPAIAKHIESAINKRIDAIKAKYGRTYLDPTEILTEKRLLADEVNFKTDSIALNLNEAKQSMYQAMDEAFDTLLPEVKDINASYSGLIEANKLVGEVARKAGNAPLLAHDTIFKSIASKFPEVAIKTRINNMLRGEAKVPQAGASALPFYPRRYGQFDRPSGSAPTGGITPINPPPVGPPDQFARPSGAAPRSLPSAREVPRGPVDQFANPSGVAPKDIIPVNPPPVGPPDYLKNPSGVAAKGPPAALPKSAMEKAPKSVIEKLEAGHEITIQGPFYVQDGEYIATRVGNGVGKWLVGKRLAKDPMNLPAKEALKKMATPERPSLLQRMKSDKGSVKLDLISVPPKEIIKRVTGEGSTPPLKGYVKRTPEQQLAADQYAQELIQRLGPDEANAAWYRYVQELEDAAESVPNTAELQQLFNATAAVAAAIRAIKGRY
jgi:ribosome-associated translation inhibitor RaiA